MKTHRLIGPAILILTAFTSPAFAQPPIAGSNLSPTPPSQARLATFCLPDPLGEVGLGGDVLDRDGVYIGWISIDQCGAGARGRLHVRLDSRVGKGLKDLPLTGVTAVDGGVKSPLSQSEILAAPDVPDAFVPKG